MCAVSRNCQIYERMQFGVIHHEFLPTIDFQTLKDCYNIFVLFYFAYSLEQLVKSNQELGRQLTEFINTCQVS